ncbi:MAG: Mur ligase family protein [Candidatus Limnocylindrales bacterium]
MRLVEVRLLDGPNLYRLEPAVRIEVAVGRRRTWYGSRLPARHALVRLSATVPASRAPHIVADLAGWVVKLHRRALNERVRATIHRTSEPGRWIVAFPWHDGKRAELIANAALRLAEEPGRGNRLFERAVRRIRETATGPGPAMVTDEQRRVPIISISGTNGKSTTTRMLAHIAMLAGRHVGMTTTDGVIVDEKMVVSGDFTGPQGAHAILERDDVDLAVLETARGGILLRGLGYESNDASVFTNISGDHLDLQGVHTLPELAEVKSVVCRVTKPDGAVVLNADDPLVAATATRMNAPVWLFSLRPASAKVKRHVQRGGTAFVLDDDGLIVERSKHGSTLILPAADIPATVGGLARHNVANALAAAGGARALGFTHEQIATGLRDFRNSAELLPGRLNMYRAGNRVVIVDYAHNVAGLEVLLETAESLIGPRGRRNSTLTTIVGSAGDRPDDYIRSLGAMAGQRSDEVAIKEGIHFLRGRSRASLVGELREGLKTANMAAADVPVYEDELEAIRGEITAEGRMAGTVDDTVRVVILMAHQLREEVASFLKSIGGVPLEGAAQFAELRAAIAAADERAQGSRSVRRSDRPAPRTRRPGRTAAS